MDFPTGNLFLDTMPEQAARLLAPFLERLPAKLAEVVYDQDAPMANVYFPLSSIISIVIEMADGSVAEVGIIGREGMTGGALALGSATSNYRAIVQVPDGALSMAASDFADCLAREPELANYARRYVQATIMVNAQVSACNSLHSSNERCARWLLMAHDRVDGDTVLLTQEFLSQMLGLRRSSVTVAASALQEAGFISYTRGQIVIRNRAGLEGASCECYHALESAWSKMMTYSIRKHATQAR